MTNRCTVTVGSVTLVSKAQRALSSAAIRSEIVKIDRYGTGRGCVYGLEFPCEQASLVGPVLGEAGIKIKHFSDGRR